MACNNARCQNDANYICGKCRRERPALAEIVDERNRAAKRNGGRQNNRRSNSSGWTPRTVGTTEDGNPVTFRQGLGYNEGHTLIADGEKSDREFRRGHNHYGPKREGGGRVDDDRGYYTGSGA